MLISAKLQPDISPSRFLAWEAHRFSTGTVTLEKTVSEAELTSALKTLPPSVHRVKGIVQLTGDDGGIKTVEVQYTPGQLDLRPCSVPPPSGISELVMIAAGDSAEQASKLLEGLGTKPG